jgi:hypothetical protein
MFGLTVLRVVCRSRRNTLVGWTESIETRRPKARVPTLSAGGEGAEGGMICSVIMASPALAEAVLAEAALAEAASRYFSRRG